MATRKVVRTITIAGITLPVYSIAPFVGESAEVDTLAAFGDASYTNVVRDIVSYGELTLTCIDEGAAIAVHPGTVVEVTLTVTFGDGDAVDVDRAATKDMNIISVEPGGDISVDGDRKATIVIKMIPLGGDDPNPA